MDALRTLRAAARGPLALATSALALAGAASAGAAADSTADPDPQVCAISLAIGFSIDGSISVGQGNFAVLTEQVANFIDSTSGFSTGAGAVNDNLYYANTWGRSLGETTEDFATNEAGSVSAAVGELTFPRGTRTNTAVGLLDLKAKFNTVPADSGASIAVVITDGMSSNAGNTMDAAEQLRNLGVTVAAVGVGNIDASAMSELNDIASVGMNGDKLVFSSDNFAGIQGLLDDVIASIDSDGDGTSDCEDGCPEDPDKTEPGECGCGEPETCKQAKLFKFKKFAKYGPGKNFVGGHKKIVVKKMPSRFSKYSKFHSRSSKFHNRSHQGGRYSAW